MYKMMPFRNSQVVVLLTLLSSSAYAGSDSFIDFEATMGIDDNVTRAAQNVDIEHDGFLTVAGTGGQVVVSGYAGTLTAKALFEINAFTRFAGLSNASAAGRLNYTFAFSTGFGAPWFSLDANYGVIEFASTQRDSNVFSAAVTMGMQIDDATSMRLGLSYRERDAESSVFDTKNSSFFVNMDWSITARDIVYITYKIETGDTFSSATTVGLPVIDASSAIVDDDVFTGKKTYRLDATTQFVTLGYNVIKDLHSSLDFSARYLESEADDVDLVYEGLTLRISYFKRFNL
jgi:hypothetical protein